MADTSTFSLRSPQFGWPAPAKLNLFLHITGQRPDGFHLLQTVFRFIDFADTLFFNVREDGVIQRTSELAGVSPEQDLVVRAARLLKSESGTGSGADIRVDKCLPVGGGLGGGSSDAATTLVALNYLWNLNLPQEQLESLGLSLGADVPVFIRGQAAWAEGVGEHLTAVELPPAWYLVIVPQCHVSTAEVFSDDQLTRDCPPITIRDFLAGAGGNVCEPVVYKRYPQVAEAAEWLSHYSPARMTGTGACIFATFNSEVDARRVLDELPDGWQAQVAKGLDASPLCKVTSQKG